MVGPTKVKDSVSAITFPTSTGQWINVTTIAGVVGDGVTNCTAPLNAAIAATPGRVYYFPEGTFLVSTASLLLGVGTILRGAGPTLSIIKNTSYATFAGPLLDTGTGTGHELHDLGFTYVGAAAAQAQGSATALVLKVRSGSKFLMQNCRVISTLRVSASIGVNSWFAPRSGAAAITDYRIEGNTITNAADIHIDLNSIVTDGYIQKNNLLSSANGSLFGIFAALCNNITINDNSSCAPVCLSGCTAVSVLNNSIIVSANPASNVSTGGLGLTKEVATESTDCLLMNNTVSVGSFAAIQNGAIAIFSNGSSNNIISGNLVLGSGHVNAGIFFKSPNNVIANNTVIGAFDISIYSQNLSANCTVIGNILKGSYTNGIQHTPTTVTDGIHIAGNVIIDCNQNNSGVNAGAAIFCNAGTTNHTVIGNHIKSPAGINPSYGVRGAALTAASMVIGNNTVTFQTALYSINAAVVAGNI